MYSCTTVLSDLILVELCNNTVIFDLILVQLTQEREASHRGNSGRGGDLKGTHPIYYT